MFKSVVKSLLALGLVFVPAFWASAAPTGTLSFTNLAGGTSTTASPGTSFQFKVFLNASVPTIGLDFFVNQIKDTLNNSPTNLFKVTARSSTGGVYDDPAPGDASATVSSYFLNQASPPTHGYSQLTSTAAGPAGTNNLVATFTVSVDPSTPNRTYTLTPTAGPASSFLGGFIDAASAQWDFTTKNALTVVVPEPATLSFLAVGGLLFGLRRPRRQV